MKTEATGFRFPGSEKAALGALTARRARKGWQLAGPGVVILAAAVAIAPQLARGNSCGHDFNVHLVSWLDCANAWRHGSLYPHWTASANYDAGEPRFVFYPPLTWMLGAALGSVLSWSLAPIVLTFLILAGTGLATRALALEACENAVATLAGCAAIFSGFTLFTAYERAAFPEFMGGVWSPLLLLFALRERRPDAPAMRRALDGSMAPLALVLGASWLSNAPLGVMASYLLAAVALLAGVLRKSWAPVVRAAVAGALALGATAFYWIPAKIEQHWVDIRQATEDPGYNFENNWAFARHTNPVLALHDEVLRQVSWISLSMIAVCLVALVVSWRRNTLPPQKSTGSRLWWIPLAAIPVVVLFLLFPIARPVWHLPEWRFLQYPWRWMEAVEAPTAIFFAAAVWPAAAGQRSRRWARPAVAGLCAAAFLGATAFAATQFFQVCYPEDTVASTLQDFRTGVGFEGMYEYEPPNADLGLIATGLPDACLVIDPLVALGKPDPNGGNPVWSASDRSCTTTFAWAGGPGANPEHRHLRADAPQSGFLVLRLLSYPSWRVRVNGALVNSLPRRADGLVAVPVAQGPVDLEINWMTTPDVTTSRWIGVLGVLALACVGFVERKKRRIQVSSTQ